MATTNKSDNTWLLQIIIIIIIIYFSMLFTMSKSIQFLRGTA
jgi:hypothetical protein